MEGGFTMIYFHNISSCIEVQSSHTKHIKNFDGETRCQCTVGKRWRGCAACIITSREILKIGLNKVGHLNIPVVCLNLYAIPSVSVINTGCPAAVKSG